MPWSWPLQSPLASMRARISGRTAKFCPSPTSVRPCQFQQILVDHRPASVFHLVDHVDKFARGAAVDAVSAADLGGGCALNVHLGAALAAPKVEPDAGMGLCARAVESHHCCHALACG